MNRNSPVRPWLADEDDDYHSYYYGYHDVCCFLVLIRILLLLEPEIQKLIEVFSFQLMVTMLFVAVDLTNTLKNQKHQINIVRTKTCISLQAKQKHWLTSLKHHIDLQTPIIDTIIQHTSTHINDDEHC